MRDVHNHPDSGNGRDIAPHHIAPYHFAPYHITPYHIEHHIPKEAEGRYYTLPFPVPAVDVASLTADAASSASAVDAANLTADATSSASATDAADLTADVASSASTADAANLTADVAGSVVDAASSAADDASPAGLSALSRITVSYRYNRAAGGRSIVDLGLMDSDGRFLGWSGSARDHVFVGPYASTRGYHMTDIKPGTWQIIVGAYKIPDAGLTVRYDITYTKKTPRWYTGDLHVHSDASDGQHDLYTLAKMAQKAGLDFIAAANHNNYSENFHLPVVPGVTFLPAVEWTHYRGHMNFFGVAAPFTESFVANSEEEMLALAAQVRASGARVSVNHPKCGLCPYLWRSEDCFDWVEVWNGPMRKANRDALAWWHDLLRQGKKIPLVGGSDYHKNFHPVRFAHPVTKVYAASPTAADLLAAVSAGHCYVTASVRGPALGLSCENGIMGDTIPWRAGINLTLSVERLRPGMKLKLVTAEGVTGIWGRYAGWSQHSGWSRHSGWSQYSGGRLTVRKPVAASWRFAYLVVVMCVLGTERIRAVSNPIYFTER